MRLNVRDRGGARQRAEKVHLKRQKIEDITLGNVTRILGEGHQKLCVKRGGAKTKTLLFQKWGTQ